MRLTPLDIHQKEFSRSLRGFDEREVDAFLDSVADEIERLFKENIDLTERNESLEEKVRQYQDMERTLHNTLLSAQRSADDLMRTTRQEADAVLKDAEVKAKDIIHSALTDKQKATSELARIKQAEEEFRASFKRLLQQHLNSIGEIKLPQDVTLMVGRAGEDFVADADVADATSWSASSLAGSAAASAGTAAPASAPASPAAPAASPRGSEMAADNRYVASLQLGDLGDADLDPDATIEFNVAEFGFGERESDLDIESID